MQYYPGDHDKKFKRKHDIDHQPVYDNLWSLI